MIGAYLLWLFETIQHSGTYRATGTVDIYPPRLEPVA